MGLQKREEGKGGGGVTFADIKGSTGEIMVTTGKTPEGAAIKEAFESVSGMITDVDIKTGEYQGEEIVNLRVKLEDQGEKPVVASFALGSFFAAKLVGVLHSADFARPLKIQVGMMKAGMQMRDKSVLAKDTVYVAGYQGETRLVPSWANGVTKLPDPLEVIVSGKKLKDMAPVNDVVGETVKVLFARMDEAQKAVHVEEEPINLAEAHAAAGATDRSAMAQRG